MTRRAGAVRTAFTLAEVVAAMGVLGVCIVAVLTAASGAVARAQATQARSAASSLVSELLDEAAALPYQDPTTTTTVLGMEAGEGWTRREQVDDVDDLNGWTENGIVDRSGNAVSGLSTWKRTVVVEWVDAATAATVQVVESGVKRVRVEVSRGGKILGSGVILRTRAWSQAVP